VFVRRKKVKGNIYYQLVRNYREDGKHKQQMLCHLGRYKSLEAAIATERKLAEHHEQQASYWSAEAQLIKDIYLDEYADQISGDFPSRLQAYLRWRASSKTLDEYERMELVDEHHDYGDQADQHRKWATAHKDRLNKFLVCKRRYF
jgi:hypothetical protein